MIRALQEDCNNPEYQAEIALWDCTLGLHSGIALWEMDWMPKNRLTYRKGEIRWVKLDPTMGEEAQKTRACLIIQSDVINRH
jgi:hypothetical protein